MYPKVFSTDPKVSVLLLKKEEEVVVKLHLVETSLETVALDVRHKPKKASHI